MFSPLLFSSFLFRLLLFAAQQLHQNEEYHLAIDSHMRFVKNWDSILIEMLKKCEDGEFAKEDRPRNVAKRKREKKNEKRTEKKQQKE